MFSSVRRHCLVLLLVLLAAAAAACSARTSAEETSDPAVASVPEVTTVTVDSQPIDRFIKVTGSLAADEQAEVSAETGGRISEHSSHQSGRDIDIGLIFLEKPDAYPHSFVVGNADNLDLEATFVMVEEFAKTAQETGGVQMIFLDFDVQGLLYTWALENGESEEYLARLFQFPHGRGSSDGIVRHEPNHAACATRPTPAGAPRPRS